MIDLQAQILRAKARLAELEQELLQLEVTAEADVLGIVQIIDGFTGLIAMDVPRAEICMRELLQKWQRAKTVKAEIDRIQEQLKGI